MSKIICYVGTVPISNETGMGRVSYNWRAAFERRGFSFIHIGLNETGPVLHSILFGKKAKELIDLNYKPDMILVHEPHAGWFKNATYPVVLFSHGLEERNWAIAIKYKYEVRTVKSMFLPIYLRFLSNKVGLLNATLLLLINNEDCKYVIDKYDRDMKDVFLFPNGYYPLSFTYRDKGAEMANILFNGTWIGRKGNSIFVQAIEQLYFINPNFNVLIAGSSVSENDVLNSFSDSVKHKVQVIPSYKQDNEISLYENTDIFVLPSYFEGQSLALTQAMSCGICCVVSDNCGQIDLINNNVNGLIFETGNAQSLCNQLNTLLLDRSLLLKFGKKAAESVKQLTWNYVSDVVAERCAQVLLKGNEDRPID